MSQALYEALRKRTGSALSRQALTEEFFKPEDEPEKLPPMSGQVEPVTECHKLRGSVLDEAKAIINGERQDVYGSPEDSFQLIANYWNTYLNSVGDFERIPETQDDAVNLTAGDVALMMTLFKIAREANQHKRDNVRDAAGYMGIYADMQGEG